MASDGKPTSESWSRVAHLYAKITNENDELTPTSQSNQQFASIIASTLPLSQATFILDMGCGNGQIIGSILNSPAAASIPPTARIVAADNSQAFVDMLIARKEKMIHEGKKIWESLEVCRWDGTTLKDVVQDNEVSHLLGGFSFLSFPEEKKDLSEALRILKPGGLFATTAMGNTDWGHLPSFILNIRPEKKLPEHGEHWKSAPGTQNFLLETGLEDVKARKFAVSLPMEIHQEGVDFVYEVFPFVKPLMEDMSEEEVARTKGLMLGYLRERYPGEGPLRLEGTAVVGWGTKK